MKYSQGKNPNSRNGFKKGYKPSLEHRTKNSQSKKGKKGFWSGKKRPDISERVRGHRHSVEANEKNRVAHLGKKLKHDERCKCFKCIPRCGNMVWNWKNGVTPIHEKIRKSLEYKLWRTAVFERDSYACVWCGSSKSGTLNADHIKPFALYPELRFAIDNGRTLCVDCHRKTSTYGFKGFPENIFINETKN